MSCCEKCNSIYFNGDGTVENTCGRKDCECHISVSPDKENQAIHSPKDSPCISQSETSEGQKEKDAKGKATQEVEDGVANIKPSLTEGVISSQDSSPSSFDDKLIKLLFEWYEDSSQKLEGLVPQIKQLIKRDYVKKEDSWNTQKKYAEAQDFLCKKLHIEKQKVRDAIKEMIRLSPNNSKLEKIIGKRLLKILELEK